MKKGVVRSTFVICKEGELVDAIYAVTGGGQAQKLLQKVKAL